MKSSKEENLSLSVSREYVAARRTPVQRGPDT